MPPNVLSKTKTMQNSQGENHQTLQHIPDRFNSFHLYHIWIKGTLQGER